MGTSWGNDSCVDGLWAVKLPLRQEEKETSGPSDLPCVRGWTYVEKAWEGRKGPEVARVLAPKTRGACVRLLPGSLALQFHPWVSLSEIEVLLQAFGAMVQTTLAFAPNLFTVTLPNGVETLAVAKVLVEDPRCVFAEPTILEELCPRS